MSRHFSEEHGPKLSYTWVRKVLQAAGWVRADGSVGNIAGGGSGGRCRVGPWASTAVSWYDLIVILADATSEIYYAQLKTARVLRRFIVIAVAISL